MIGKSRHVEFCTWHGDVRQALTRREISNGNYRLFIKLLMCKDAPNKMFIYFYFECIYFYFYFEFFFKDIRN